MSGFNHLVMKTREAAAGNLSCLFTGEALAAALVLNRGDWLAKMGYTIPQALERIGTEWVGMIPAAAEVINKANAALAKAAKTACDESALTNLVAGSETEIDVNADLVTYGNAPGYRDVSFTLDVQRFGATTKHRLRLQVKAKDSATMARHILDVHRLAWDGQCPIDVQQGEQRPHWIG